MKQFITKVTVTGADDSVDPEDLLRISQEYPFVEFGILLSESSMGSTRFPSRQWIRNFFDAVRNQSQQINISGHICGGWVRQILLGMWPKWIFMDIDEDYLKMFSRWQINTHAIPHDINHDQLPFIWSELDQYNNIVIFQYDDVNIQLVEIAKKAGCKNIAALFDLSHGAGVLPAEWPLPLDGVACGYAGGLSPENVAEQLCALEAVVGDNQIWIDAETKLRSGYGNNFDLDYVREFLHNAQPWVITGG